MSKEILENDCSKAAPRKLSEVAKVGDYVDYPVDYANVRDMDDYTNIKTGWRVLVCEEGNVKLVSAGIPLRYYHGDDSDYSVDLLRIDFLYIPIDDSRYGFIKCGFSTSGRDLSKVFPSEYTLSVRALTKEDIEGASKLKRVNYDYYITKSELFKTGASYWLASVDEGPYMWRVDKDGNVQGRHGFVSGIRPVVRLKSKIQTTGKNANGAWKICMPKLK